VSERTSDSEWVSDWVTLATDLRLSRSRLWCYCDVVIWYLVTFRLQFLPYSSGHFEERAYFWSTFPPCPSVLSNNTTNQVHKFLNHKYIHRSNSATCFGLKLKDTQDLYILLITMNSSADRGSILLRISGNKQPVHMVARTVRVYFHKPLVICCVNQ